DPVPLLLAAVLLFFANASAAEETASTDTIDTSRLVVTAAAEPESFTSPSIEKAAEQEREIAGGFTIRSADAMQQGRASSFEDFLKPAPGLTLQTDNGTEVTKVSIRGSGILSEDEPLGVQFFLDGLPLNQGDGEAILEDFDLATLKYAEVFRGANALKFGSL